MDLKVLVFVVLGLVDATPSPAPARPAPCFRTRTKYLPIDMKGTERTVVDNPQQCQERCLTTKGCAHFSWFADGGCSIQDSKANRARAVGDGMSGPSHCRDFCYVNGMRYEPDMQGQHRTDTISAEDCQDRCANVDGCASFVWFPDGGCHLQDASAKISSAHWNIVSGGSNCDPTTTVTTTTITTTTGTTTTETTTVTTLTTTSKTSTTKTSTITMTTTTMTTTKTSTTKTSTKTMTTTTMTTTKTVTTTTATLTTSTTSATSTATATHTSTTVTHTTSTTITTTTSPPAVCLITAKKFEPETMKGTERTEVSSPYLCQTKCRKTGGCTHFSWWGRDGGCHLQDGAAKQVDAADDVITGPDTCRRFSYCFENRHKWDPPMKNEDKSTEASADACQQRCKAAFNCKHFSFWSNGECSLQDAEAKRQDAENNVIGGPDSCDYDWEQQDGYLPHGHNVFSGHYTPEQAKLKCINFADCKGITYQGSPDETGAIKVYLKSVGTVDSKSAGKGWTTWLNKGPATEQEEEEEEEKSNRTSSNSSDTVNDFSVFSTPFASGPGISSTTVGAGMSGIAAFGLAVLVVGVLRRHRAYSQVVVYPLLPDEAPDEVLLE